MLGADDLVEREAYEVEERLVGVDDASCVGLCDHDRRRDHVEQRAVVFEVEDRGAHHRNFRLRRAKPVSLDL
jgi:hypothetical protein